ncbi:MAG: phosphoglyceromutase [Planctomycetes bacterium]|nr:phosphoglyceromutase [Planctomycetota bacterium]
MGNKKNNPLCLAKMPCLKQLVGGSCILSSGNISRREFLFKSLDATLGVTGIPQSATGQTALLTGKNAAQSLGYHLPAFPNQHLIEIIQRFSIFKQIRDRGLECCFANGYQDNYFADTDKEHSVTTECSKAAGLRFRFLEDVLKQRAVYWDITNDYLHYKVDAAIPIIAASDAGKNLAKVAQSHHFTLFEGFESDLIGHSRDQERAIVFLEKLDNFLQGVLTYRDPDLTVVLSSDHGNIEDLSQGTHTRNPVPLLVIGNESRLFESAECITDIVSSITMFFDTST